MKLSLSVNATLENAAPARDACWFWISRRIDYMPCCSSDGSCAFTNRLRPLTAACHRSSTPVMVGRLTVAVVGSHGQRVESVSMLASVLLTFSDDRLPSVPSDSAAMLRCCHLAG